MKGHMIVLRHQQGDSWDYCVIEHLGTKATVEANRPAPPTSQMALGEWHNDTFASRTVVDGVRQGDGDR